MPSLHLTAPHSYLLEVVQAGPACAEDTGDTCTLAGLLAGRFVHLNLLAAWTSVQAFGDVEAAPMDGGSNRAFCTCAPRTTSSAPAPAPSASEEMSEGNSRLWRPSRC